MVLSIIIVMTLKGQGMLYWRLYLWPRLWPWALLWNRECLGSRSDGYTKPSDLALASPLTTPLQLAHAAQSSRRPRYSVFFAVLDLDNSGVDRARASIEVQHGLLRPDDDDG